MAFKRLKTKQSKRVPARQKYKIQKKIRQHNKKKRREERKHPKKSAKSKLIQIPNVCPFKEDILKDVARAKEVQEREKQQRRERLRLESIQKRANTNSQSLESMVESAEMRGSVHSAFHDDAYDPNDENNYKLNSKKENSLKAYFKEFKKVIEAADVVLEVVDARDPLGTRCAEVAQSVREAPGGKKLILILNKADLVPKDNIDKWLKYLRRFSPVIPFKASTQSQNNKLGHRKVNASEKTFVGSTCIGAELLMSMLGNYCRNKSIKTSIRVGIVGIPNVGKSSIINSLTRGRTCNVGATPGVTKQLQEVEIDSKIKIMDSPGVVFHSPNDSKTPAVLRNAQRISDIKDPFTVAEMILKRATKQYFCKLYDITSYDSPEEFFAKKAIRMGKMKGKGLPDVETAARSMLNDWNTGKIKYCSQPPEEEEEGFVSAAIVSNSEDYREFEVENFEEMEAEILNASAVVDDDDMIKFSKTEKFEKMDEDTTEQSEPSHPNIIEEQDDDDDDEDEDTMLQRLVPQKRNKRDSVMGLQGNQSINKDKQKQRKKQMKQTKKQLQKIKASVVDGDTVME